MVKLMRRTKILVSILLIIWLVGCSGKQGAEQELKGDAIIVAATFLLNIFNIVIFKILWND